MKYIPYVLIILALAVTCALIISDELLIPRGYNLAIDGYVISKTLCILFLLNTIVNLSLHFKKKSDS